MVKSVHLFRVFCDGIFKKACLSLSAGLTVLHIKVSHSQMLEPSTVIRFHKLAGIVTSCRVLKVDRPA